MKNDLLTILVKFIGIFAIAFILFQLVGGIMIV